MNSDAINTTNKMKIIGYSLMALCFIWSIVDYYTLKGAFDIIKFWVNISMLLVFGNTTKRLIGERLKGKVDEKC